MIKIIGKCLLIILLLEYSCLTKLQTKQGLGFCAWENGICHIPGGNTAYCTVQYGYGRRWATRYRVHRSIRCNNRVFGDPYFGVRKYCRIISCVA